MPAAIAGASALAHPSRRRIADELAGVPDGLTVSALADRVGLHHNAVRQHLQTMAAAGLVSVGRDAPRGRGRPSDRYRLVDPEAPRLAAYGELVALLVGVIDRAGVAPDVIVEVGRDHAAAAGGADGGLAAVAEALARLGFAPRETGRVRDRRDGRLALRLDSCPFREAVRAPGGRLVCDLHRGLVEGLADRASPGAVVTEFEPRDPDVAGCRVTVLPASGGP